MREHDYCKGCESGDCGGMCNLCCLAICNVCGLAEGELTTECPGVPSHEHGRGVYEGREDFRDGKWVKLIMEGSQ